MTDEPTDLQLIEQIKTKNDSNAVTELVNRHTGIYIQVVKKYACYPDFLARTNVNDLKDEKFFNIYKWALKYDSARATESGKPMQFGSYVGKMTTFMCKNIITRGDESVQFNEFIAPNNDTSVVEQTNHDSDIEQIKREAEEIEDPLFRQIFRLRFGGQKPRSWRAIGAQIGMSYEGARKVFNRHIGQVRDNLTT